MDWSADIETFEGDIEKWFHPASNVLLDFHGDPVNADLVVFSDGNHNMALKEVLQAFKKRCPGMKGYFYVTTPPGPVVRLLEGRLQLGNFVLSVMPHIFMGPQHVMDMLVHKGRINAYFPFVRNQGSVLLVRKGNPKQIFHVHHLTKRGVTLFLSNPETEKASFTGYFNTLINLAEEKDIVDNIDVIYGECIHHREAPAAIQKGAADAALVYYHLGRHYTRLFPDTFEMIPLGGSVDTPAPFEGNLTAKTYAGKVGDGGEFGREFLAFLTSPAVEKIYRCHGLVALEN